MVDASASDDIARLVCTCISESSSVMVAAVCGLRNDLSRRIIRPALTQRLSWLTRVARTCSVLRLPQRHVTLHYSIACMYFVLLIYMSMNMYSTCLLTRSVFHYLICVAKLFYADLKQYGILDCAGPEIKSRHLRVCLFDGQNVSRDTFGNINSCQGRQAPSTLGLFATLQQ